VLEADMDEPLGAQKSERTAERLGYRSGYYTRTLVTRVGKLVLRVPQDRQGRFRTEVFERYQRSEKAFVAALAEMYIQGVSTRKVKEITEQLCGHEFSAASISRVTAKLDEELKKFMQRRLEEEYPYAVVDARYEKVREDGVIASRAVQVAIGINWEGRRCVIGVELANRESASSWKEFLLGLKQRGLCGVVCVISDDHPGLRQAIPEVLPEAKWQRCYVHFLRNALDHLPRKKDDDALTELRWIYERRNVQEARRDLAAWLNEMGGAIPQVV
jgi:putative transposase